jgi:hypothetical protein
MSQVPSEEEKARIAVRKMALMSPRTKELPPLTTIEVKRPRIGGSPSSLNRKPLGIQMHEKYKKMVKLRYPTVQMALGILDFNGKGIIKTHDLLKFYKSFHLGYTEEQINEYIIELNLVGGDGMLNKAELAKAYYGHHFRNNFETPGLIAAVLRMQENDKGDEIGDKEDCGVKFEDRKEYFKRYDGEILTF